MSEHYPPPMIDPKYLRRANGVATEKDLREIRELEARLKAGGPYYLAKEDKLNGHLHVMMGIPGSGKSTVASDIQKRHNAIRISPDEIRRMLTGDINNQERNGEVFRIAHDATRANLGQGHHVIFDATNVKREQRVPLLNIARSEGAQRHLHIVNPGLGVASKRNAERTERVVPQEVLDRMHQEMVDSGESIPTEGWDTVRTYE